MAFALPPGLVDGSPELQATGTVCGISSEGGLLEYASDTAIVANLKSLYTGTAADATFVGSVTRDGEPARVSQNASGVTTCPRTLDAFRDVTGEAGWIVQHVIERPFSYNVRLVKA